jgi:HD-GYP domain-containing protein (c-di-GMP phosphodiesterase class II)
MRIAAEAGLPEETRSDLFYALLLKDCGCSGNASKLFRSLGSDDLSAKHDVKTTDWTRLSYETLRYALSHVGQGKPFLERSKLLFQLAMRQKRHQREIIKIRCERGSTLAGLMGLSAKTGGGILNLDEHWDGSGFPEGLRKREIPILSRIMLLAQTIEVFRARDGGDAWLDPIRQRRATWFDPELVRASESLAARGALWPGADGAAAYETVLELEPRPRTLSKGTDSLDAIAVAFANIVDAKSPYTFNHSIGVANATVTIALKVGLPKERIVFLRHAALLHDLGKLGVSNAILEKPGKLDDDEWAAVRRHPYYTWKTLNGIPGFGELSEVAASHHEKLDGSGYFRGLTGDRLPMEARILAVADVFDALAAKRPYRDSLPIEKVLEILRKDSARALDRDCVEAVAEAGMVADQGFVDLETLAGRLEKFQRTATPVTVPDSPVVHP